MIVLVADRLAASNGPNSDRRIGAFDAQFVRWAKENEEGSSTDE